MVPFLLDLFLLKPLVSHMSWQCGSSDALVSVCPWEGRSSDSLVRLKGRHIVLIIHLLIVGVY